MIPPEMTWFRALHYSGPHVCLWMAILPDGALHVRSEQQWPRGVISRIAKDIHARTRDLDIEKVRYTVGDKAQLVGKTSDDSYGETRLQTFRAHKIPIREQTSDPVQGWTRLQELLAPRQDGRPWLTIDPSCVHLIRAITNAVSDPDHLDDIVVAADDQALHALRVGVMSRPTPVKLGKPPLPKNAVGHLLNAIRRGERPRGHLIDWR